MKRILRLLLLLCIALQVVVSAAAHIRNYGINEGMPDNTANCLTQDNRGFVWIGTSNGLVRFDGMFFSVFRHDNLDAASLSNNNVHWLLPVEEGMYVAHDAGLDWYSYADGFFHRCTSAEQGVNGARIISIKMIGKRVVVTTEHGDVLSVNGSKMERIHTGKRLYVVEPTPWGVFALGDGKAFLYTPDMRWLKASVKTDVRWRRETMAYYSGREKRVFVGSGIGTKSCAYELNANGLRQTAEPVPADLRAVADCPNATAFATDGRGVMLRSHAAERWLTQNRDGICGDAVYSLLADRSENLWIGTYRTGISLVSSVQQPFARLREADRTLPFDLVTAVAASPDEAYVGMDGGGLGVYNLRTRVLHIFTTANSPICGNNIVSMANDGRWLWMAVFGRGVAAYDTHTAAITNYTLPLQSKSGDVIWTLKYDGEGKLWIGGRDVFLMHCATGKLHTVQALVGTHAQAFSIRGAYVWMASSEGLYKVNRRTLTVEAFYNAATNPKLPSSNVRYVYADKCGYVWISFCDADLCRLDPRTRELKVYGSKQGLETYAVTGITESAHGYMLFATGNGLYYYNPHTDLFLRCDKDNNLPTSYNYGAACATRSLMLFGSTQGLVMCDDTPLKPNTLFKDVSFTALKVTNGRTLNLNGSNPQRITLRSDENYFSVAFAAPEYTAPHALRFECYLKGMETGWKTMATNRTANYTNVPPGDYQFLVRCTNLNGTWTTVSTLPIRVLPPWYLTWWAKTLWTLLTLALITIAVSIYLYQLKMHHKMELAEVEKQSQRQLDNAKMNYFTNITHELRTPVFLIAAQIEELIDRRNSVVSVPSAYLYSMQRSTRKLNQLISRAIDFRKMDQGKLTLKRENVDMVHFLKNLADDYDDLCEQKDISFSLHTPDHKVVLSIDREKIEMCINNLISNAFKYTKRGGHITLALEQKPQAVVLSVKDDGIGIVPEAREQIFADFYRTERGKAYGAGDGIGLSFVKTLVDMHGGRIWLQSEVNEGSEFFISIPSDADEVRNADEVKDVLKCCDADGVKDVISPSHHQLPSGGALVSSTPTTLHPHHLTTSPSPSTPTKSNPSATHRLLLIDDDRETIGLLERNLVSDFTVLKAYDREQGIKVATESLPDLIVCDMMMPNLDGIGFLQQLKNDRKLQHIKVIILTGQTSEEERIAAYDAGADAYLTKPVSLKLLRTRINRMIAESDTAALTNELARENRTYTKEEQIFLLRCREIIDNNLANPDFNVDFLAEQLAMSHSALYKKLKQMTSMSLIEFVNDYKIFKAVQMFKEGQTCVERVAEQCGFGDVKNFRTLFKRKMQVTPKQYVQSL